MHLYWKHMLEAKVIFFTDNESYNSFEEFLKTWVFYHSLWLVELEETPPPHQIKTHFTLNCSPPKPTTTNKKYEGGKEDKKGENGRELFEKLQVTRN